MGMLSNSNVTEHSFGADKRVQFFVDKANGIASLLIK